MSDKKKPVKKMKSALRQADYDLQHAVVRGESKKVIDALRTKRDAAKKD